MVSDVIKFAKPVLSLKIPDFVNDIFSSGVFVHGRYTKEFESKFGAHFGYMNCTTVSSATTGLHLAHIILKERIKDIPEEPEVICSSMTHVATVSSVVMAGLKPVFIDATLEDGNLDVTSLEEKISENTVGIALVHFNGVPANMEEVVKLAKKNSLYIVEDCAIALGASFQDKPVGLHGDLGVFSFHPVKQLTAGEGGMVVSNSSELISEINLRKAFGVNSQFNQRKVPGVYNVTAFGLNYRMPELSAAVGLAQMTLVQDHLDARRLNAGYLSSELKELDDRLTILGRKLEGGRSHYCLIGLLRDTNREERAAKMIKLREEGLETSVYYPHPIQRLSAFAERWDFNPSDHEISQVIADSSIAFPIGPHLSEADISKMVRIIKRVI